VTTACCPRCRLLQPAVDACADCGTRPLRLDDELDRLLSWQIEGLTRVPKQPATGWRDAVALVGTGLGVMVGCVAGVGLLGHPAGMLVGGLVGAFGYRKQYWKARLVRRRALRPVPRPSSHPEQRGLVGRVRRFERDVRVPRTGEVVIATSIVVAAGAGGGTLVRATRVAPFWLVVDDQRRILVTGPCWVHAAAPTVEHRDVRATLDELAVPPGLRLPRGAVVEVATVRAGDQVAVDGELREELLPAAGGYRDGTVETIRAEIDRPVWIHRR